MKTILLLLVALAWVTAPAAQTHVSFVHGFNDNPQGAWSVYKPILESEYNITTTAPRWFVDSRLNDVASSFDTPSRVPSGSVALAHSTGGVISREIQRINGDNYLSGLITVGTPHLGAPVAELGNNADVILNVWYRDLINPWYSFGVPRGLQQYLNGVVNDLIGRADAAFVDPLLSQPAVADLAPSSPLIQQLNQSPGASLPPLSRTVAIYGHENSYTFARFSDSFYNDLTTGSRLETGIGIRLLGGIVGTYLSVSSQAQATASFFYSRYTYSYDYNDYARYQYWASVSASFYFSALTIAGRWQADYSYALLGNRYFDNGPGEDDGFIPIGSQNPSFVIDRNRLAARGDNHLEETESRETLNRIREAFRILDISRRSTGPGGPGPGDPGPGGPTPGPDPGHCPDDPHGLRCSQ